MFEINKYNPSIKINLNNGIYIFDSKSAIGKTRLCNELKTLQAYGEPVAGYTYNDLKLGQNLDNLLNNRFYKVIMIDRYDLYKNLYIEGIEQASKYCIILVDCKGESPFNLDYDICKIEMTIDLIEVT